MLEVDEGILEAADAMGATPLQTVWHFMLPEAAASLILALTTATIGLLGATAMAGTVGGGESGIWLLPMAISASTLSPPSLPPTVLIVIVQLIQTLGTRRLAGCVAINRSTAPGLTRLACADRGEGAGYPRNIAVVEPGHADPTAGDQIDAMLLTQNVYLIGAKAGVTEHAALGQQIGKIPAGRAACRAFTSATRMALMRVRMASTSSCHRAFSSGSLSTCDTTGRQTPAGWSSCGARWLSTGPARARRHRRCHRPPTGRRRARRTAKKSSRTSC